LKSFTLGIRSRAALLAAVAALPLFALSIHHAIEDRAEALERARQEALLIARSHAASQAGLIDRTRYVLAGVAAGLASQGSVRRCGVPLPRIVAANPFHANASLADAAGNVLCSVEPLTKAVNIADRSYFQQAFAHGEFAVSELLTSRLSERPRVAIAYPVLGEQGDVLAMLVASLDPTLLSDSLKRGPSSHDAVVVLVDAAGRQIARLPEEPDFRGRALPGFAIPVSSEGFLDFVGLDGVERIAAYASVPQSPLFIVAGLSRAEVDSGPREMLLRSLGLVLGVLALAMAVSLLGAHRLIVAPLRKLTMAAELYGKGHLKARSGVSHEPGEIGTLARTFDQLAAHNERTTRALRTLSAGNRTLLREKNEPALMAAMCRVAVDHGGYRLALVNQALDDPHKSVRTVAQAGHDEGFVERLNLTWADSERGRGSVGTAIRTGRTCVVRTMAHDPRFAPWRDAAIARGYGSIASFPLLVEGHVTGTFSLIAAEADAFDDAEVHLLEEMAADLSFGIEVLRRDARRIAAEEAAGHATTHDPVTGLPGRIPFLRMLEAATARGESFAVMAVNVGHLQDLNDSLGYSAVSTTVMESVKRLKFAMTPATGLARLATDDFAMILPKGDIENTAALARRLQALFSAPIEVNDVPIEVRLGVGAAMFPGQGNDPELLVRRASIAAREASRRELPFFLYQGATERENPQRLALAAQLRKAIGERQLLLHFQSKVDLAWGGVRGAEALVRWAHPDKGMIAPMQFVPIAEQTGLIRPMTSLVIELAVRQLRAWRERARQIPIAVNLSPRNLHEPGFVEQIERLLRQEDVPPALLEFEITESALAEDPQKARDVLAELRALGAKLYIDDFGTGYSSLSYLVSLPVHALKIDRSFVRQMSKSREAHAVVSSIVLMARELGLQTVAEGVETKEDADLLLRLGCDEAQGYFFAKPVPAGEFSYGHAHSVHQDAGRRE
jgi:diguanylate cyclase (GGDEF)-like protein